MKRLSGSEIRRAYLSFFQQRSHAVVPSSSLISGNDPTLLFANSGMVQFKDTFLGLEPRPYSRATTSQKCLRVSGKHNDLEEVGPSPRHHTFFEMLGNFSFGDYFKEQAIPFAWEFLTQVLELPIERLWFTVFEGNDRVPADSEAVELWKQVGVAPERILNFGEKDNFWVMADTGPCGPNSEITVYIGDDMRKMHAGGVNSDDPDYVEIWNLVFMQFERASMQRLPRPSIDTGMGLERVAMVLQGKHATYDTDLFTPLFTRTMELLGSDEVHYHANQTSYRVVADHSRSIAFLIADGVLPGNTGRSYVLRRLLRRAAYHGRRIGFERPFLAPVVAKVIDEMAEAYPELVSRREFILEVTESEESQFLRTLSGGLVKLQAVIDLARRSNMSTIVGDDAFTLKDTFGFPLDLTQRIAAEQGLTVDEPGYERRMDEQRERGRKAAQFKRGGDAELFTELALPEVRFTGYAELAGVARVLALVSDNDSLAEAVAGQAVQVVLDATPFYAESGGQVGDSGQLVGPHGTVQVDDTQRPLPGLIVHYGRVVEGTLRIGETVQAQVDTARRNDTMRNHTATHLLHRVLRDTLGEHAAQAGSLVAPDRLRFDFTHTRQVTPEQLHAIAQRVNAWIRADTPVSWIETGYQDALQLGAMALFGEKYGDTVRMVSVGCDQQPAGLCSRELCGGTHVQRTGEIGFFRILAESSVASGVRRIEALTGAGAEQWVDSQAGVLRELAARLSVPPAQIAEKLDGLLTELKERQRENEALRTRLEGDLLEQLLREAGHVGDVHFVAAQVEAPDAGRLRAMGDRLRDKLGSGVVVLAAVIDEKVQLLAMVTPDLHGKGLHAGQIVKRLAPLVGGSGGGRPDMAQAGGRDLHGVGAALAAVADMMAESQTKNEM